MKKLLLILVFIVIVSPPLLAETVDTAWVRSYNAPENTQDDAYALAVDDSGNVFVTGTCGTIKYDPDGTQLWIKTTDGRNHGD